MVVEEYVIIKWTLHYDPAGLALYKDYNQLDIFDLILTYVLK